MDAHVRSVNKLVKTYDSRLLAKRDPKGMIHIYRKKPMRDVFSYKDVNYVHVFYVDDYIVSLTDTWGHEGQSVDWGLEPLWQKLSQMDSWRDDTGLERFNKSRTRFEEDQKRQQKNEFRARAADMRRDFAKATNDIVIRQDSLDRNKNKKFF